MVIVILKKKKEQEEVSYPIVKPPRTKKDQYRVELLLDPSGGHREEADSFKVSMRISRESAKKLHDYIIDDPEGFAYDFLMNIEAIPLEKIQSDKYLFIDSLKRQSAWLYAFFSYWCKKPISIWPKYLLNLLEKVEAENKASRLKDKHGNYNPKGMTYYAVGECFGQQIENYGIKINYEEDNFYITYIIESRRSKAVSKAFIRGRSPEEIEKLAYRPPLKAIFKKLKLI